MRNHFLTLQLFLLMFLISSPASGAGTSTGLLLKEEPTARSFGMAGLASGLADDADTFWSNPAGLDGITRPEISLSIWKGLDAVSQYHFVGMVAPMKNLGTLNVGYLSYDSGLEEIFELDNTSRKVKLQKDQVFLIGWGRHLTDWLFIGLNGKQLQSQLAETYKAETLTGDMAVLLRTLDDRLSLGFSLRNFTGGLQYLRESDPLPRVFSGGLSYRLILPLSHELLTGLDLQKANDSELVEGAIGLEYLPGISFLALRLGVRKMENETEFSTGLGLKWGMVGLDYGFRPSGNLGQVSHRISLGIRFGQGDAYNRALTYREKGLSEKAAVLLQNIPPEHQDYTPAQIALKELEAERQVLLSKEKIRPTRSFEAVVAELGEQARRKNLDQLRIAIGDIAPASGGEPLFQDFLQSQLSVSLVRSDIFVEISRKELNQLLEEAKLSLSGIVDPSQAMSLGKVKGVDALLIGTYWERPEGIQVNLSLLQTGTGEKLAAATLVLSHAELPKSKRP